MVITMQSVNSWCFVEKMNIYLMLVLAVGMLFLPLLLQPPEAEAAVGVIVSTIIIAGVTIYVNMCKNCYAVVGASTHWYTCPLGHAYYTCKSGNTWLHEPCHNTSGSSEESSS